jgi:hypothetical protein
MLCNGGGAPILAVCPGGLRLASSIEAVAKRVCRGRWADLASPGCGGVSALIRALKPRLLVAAVRHR